jgi:hypothetical protein
VRWVRPHLARRGAAHNAPGIYAEITKRGGTLAANTQKRTFSWVASFESKPGGELDE